jgi:hypothetical protein
MFCFHEIHVVALSITFLAALIICLIISFIVSYLAHRPRLALAIPSSLCLLHCTSFCNCHVMPVTSRLFTYYYKLYSRELHASRCFLALGSPNSLSPLWSTLLHVLCVTCHFQEPLPHHFTRIVITHIITVTFFSATDLQPVVAIVISYYYSLHSYVTHTHC